LFEIFDPFDSLIAANLKIVGHKHNRKRDNKNRRHQGYVSADYFFHFAKILKKIEKLKTKMLYKSKNTLTFAGGICYEDQSYFENPTS
jgi:hypothetical protein